MVDTPRRPVAFTHIRLENWRNFRELNLPLRRRAFLAGPNASGKSNFLDVFRFLRDLVSVGGGFQDAVRRRGGVSRLRSLAARRYPEVAVVATIGSEDEPQSWEYELRFAQDNQRRPIIRRERVFRRGVEILSRPDVQDQADTERLTQTYLEQLNVNREFRDVADFFSSVRYLHVVPQLVREPDRSVGKVDDPYGGDFLEQVTKTVDRTRQARLRRIRDALKVAVPQLSEIELQRDDRGTPHLRGRYEHWRPGAGWQAEDQFSDGTLRLMGLLWAVQDGSGPLLLEEPELSLHEGVVSVIPQLLDNVQRRANRQIMCSTHSSGMLSDEGIEPDELILLIPRKEGTEAQLASSRQDVRALLEGGATLADAVLPLTRPSGAGELALFGR
jgi:predicted ATPase